MFESPFHSLGIGEAILVVLGCALLSGVTAIIGFWVVVWWLARMQRR